MYRLAALLILLLSCSAHAVTRSGLKDALAKKLVSISAEASGESYHQKGLRLKVKNNTATTMQLTVDPALIFRPSDTGYQDLVLPGETMIALAAHGETTVDLQSFCGKSYARAPSRALTFDFARQGDSAMIRVTQFLNKYRLYNSAGQQAIWVLTNDHDLSGIYDPQQPQVSNKLLALLVQLTGKPVPDYFRLYKLNNSSGEPAFEKRVLNIYSVFEWQLHSPDKLTMGIYDAHGLLIQSVLDQKDFPKKGSYKMAVQFEAENVAPGKYYIRLKNQQGMMREQVVEVD